MSMSKKVSGRQEQLWIPAHQLARGPGHPFYRKLNQVLAAQGFDRFVEQQCARFYAERLGRPSIPPGVYFRMLMVGYFEGTGSEREIDWRCSDSLSLREFLGYAPTKTTPDHSTLSKTRERIDLETHRQVLCWVLKVLADQGLLEGKTIGIDATTLEANAALRSIVRRDSGEEYEKFLQALAKASGIKTPTREELARLDRERKGKGSNKDWEHPHDPDARIAKMKDGRTKMAHKAEHAVDMDSCAIVAVTVQCADQGDTTTLYETLSEAAQNLEQVREPPPEPGASQRESAGHPGVEPRMREMVTDKGYHSNDTVRDVGELGIRSYLSEPQRGPRRWKGKEAERVAVYGNRRRIRGARGKALLRRRAEVIERCNAHLYETGGMRRVHVRGHPRILKRLLVHACGLNLGLVMRKLCGAGKPRALQALGASALEGLSHAGAVLKSLAARVLAALLRSGSLGARAPALCATARSATPAHRAPSQ